MDVAMDAPVSRSLYARRAFHRRHRSASDQQENGHRTRWRNRLSLNNGATKMKMPGARRKLAVYGRGDHERDKSAFYRGRPDAMYSRPIPVTHLEQYSFEQYVLKVCIT